MKNTDVDLMNVDAMDTMGDIIPSVAIDGIISARCAGLQKYTDALILLKEAKALFNAASGERAAYGFDECVHNAVRWGNEPERNIKAIKKIVDEKIWRRLMKDTGMNTLMSRKQHDEWEKQLEGDSMPEITLETVMATFKHLSENKLETFEQGVVDVFRALSWDYKTNNPCKLGKKIILERLLDVRWKGYASVSYSGVAQLNDLAKPFYLLDGKNVPDNRVSDGAAFTDFFSQEKFSGAVFDGVYFSVRYFKKGSAHIVFKRHELVDKINEIVSRYYPDMLPSRV